MIAHCKDRPGTTLGRMASHGTVWVACVILGIVLSMQPVQAQTDSATKEKVGRAPFKDCPDCPEMVAIQAGTHTLFGEGLPANSISVSRFALGKTLVTQGQWQAIMGSNPSNFSSCGNSCPVEQVSWNDVQQYIQRLSQKTGHTYRLPTEAEWEYACMAGKTTSYCGGEDLDSVAWYRENSRGATHPVAARQPNGFGLYDMSGNVWEWMSDCWNGDCKLRVLRGGSLVDTPQVIRSAFRVRTTPAVRYDNNGFRVARMLP